MKQIKSAIKKYNRRRVLASQEARRLIEEDTRGILSTLNLQAARVLSNRKVK